MKRLGSILLVAGCLSGTLQPYAQEYPAGPLLRARRKLRQAIQTRAEKAATTAVPMVPKRDLSKEVGLWRMSVGNTSADNWSPYPDRALDARTLRFPLPRDSRADKRPDNLKALDRMRQQKR